MEEKLVREELEKMKLARQQFDIAMVKRDFYQFARRALSNPSSAPSPGRVEARKRQKEQLLEEADKERKISHVMKFIDARNRQQEPATETAAKHTEQKMAQPPGVLPPQKKVDQQASLTALRESFRSLKEEVGSLLQTARSQNKPKVKEPAPTKFSEVIASISSGKASVPAAPLLQHQPANQPKAKVDDRKQETKEVMDILAADSKVRKQPDLKQGNAVQSQQQRLQDILSREIKKDNRMVL